MSSTLHDMFYEVMDTYAEVKKGEFAGTPFRGTFPDGVVEYFNNYLSTKGEQNYYKVKGSIGMGNWANVPWLAVLDKRSGCSVQAGVYIVYLFNKDTKELILSLAQGVTQANKEELLSNTRKYRELLGIGTLEVGPNSLDEAYNDGIIQFKKYSLTILPDDNELKKDFEEYLALYDRYYKDVFSHENTPHSPGISVDKISIDSITKYIRSRGFYYPDKLIKNYYLSLRTKPFVILAGISGTGKSKIVELFADAINAQFKLVPVRPDWSDSTDLFGHVDLKGEFKDRSVTEYIRDAIANPEKPYFLCLDEMNLARVEYYLSDFLSIIETRKKVNGRIVTKEFVLADGSKLLLPDNLYVVGTVNMDETTFPFSKKVLDRANTIEFSEVDLKPDYTSYEEDAELVKNANNDFLRSEYLVLKDCLGNMEEKLVIDSCVKKLAKINEILASANLQVGYRVRDEICFYSIYNSKLGLLSVNDCMENAIMQKILPRIQGSSNKIRSILSDIYDYVHSGFNDNPDKILKEDETENAAEKLKSNSGDSLVCKKIADMIDRFDTDGFASFWA